MSTPEHKEKIWNLIKDIKTGMLVTQDSHMGIKARPMQLVQEEYDGKLWFFADLGTKKAQEIVTEASGVGTRMHKYLEDYIETGQWPSPGSNPYAQKAHNMASVIKEKAMVDVNEIWGSEVPLYVPQLYAGTTDLVGVYKGNPCIMDFKQTNKPKKLEWVEDYFLQLTAYAIAHNEIHNTEIREGHIFMCSRAGEYQQFDLWPNEFDDWKTEWWNRVYQYYDKHH